MASTKVYNPNTQAWEVVGSSHASEIGILDTEDNFTNKNVEGSLRELANRTDENALEVNAVKTSIQNANATINKINEEFNEHITNHPGGSGGGAGGCKITSTFEGGVIDSDTDLYIPIFFTPSNGATNGTAYIMINDIEVGMVMLERGNNRIHIGTLTSIKNEIAIYAKDNKGNMSDMLYWTVIKGGIDFTLNFDYNADYSIDDVIRAQYVIETPLEGELYMEVTVDNVKTEVPIKRVGAGEYIFSGLGIGVHPVTMVVKSGIYSSKKYSFNLVIVSSYNLYLSSTFQNGEFEFGTPIIIDYRVSKLSSEIFTVKLILDGNVTKTLKVPTGAYTWTLSNLGVGEHTIRIECSSDQGEFVFIEKEVAIFVGEYTPVEPIMSGLLAYFDANTMTNNDENKEYWTDSSGNNVVARLHNFNYKVNGWIEEQTSSGRTEKVLRCDNEAYVEIDLKPFKDNAKLGCTIDVLYKAKNIGLEEARVIDYTDTEAPFKGIYANVTETVFKSATNTGTVYLDEDTEIRLTYVIDRVNKFGKIYVNGVLNRPFYLSDNGSGVNAFYEDFTHNEKIYLNSEKGIKNFGACDFKKLRVYGRALTDDEIIRNHLADIEDLNIQRERYKFNFENKTTPAIKIYADESTLGNMTDTITVPVRVKYESPNEEFFGSSFDLPACDICYQGTSSLQYVLKNYTIRLKDENGAPFMYTPYKNGVKENIFCLKADYMESSHANNVGMAKFINGCVYDTKTPAQLIDPNRRTTIDGFPILLYINDKLQGAYNFNLDRYSTESFGYKDFPKCIVYEVSANSDTTAGAFHKWTSNSGKSEIDYYKSDFECLYPPSRAGGSDNFAELIRLVNWVDTASDELFKEQIHEYFNLEYLLRYYLVVMVIGAVDNLGKNMKLVSYDGLIWYPQFYDMDTILGLDNTGFLKFGSDIEVEAGIFNTSGSKLWEKVRRLFAVELKEQYALMRLDRFTVANMMKYLYDEQIAAIPETVYNQDMKTKYLNFGSSYLYACHGNREQHMKKWIRERLVYCDTLMGYTGSTNDYITIRSNKLGHVYLDLETYVPMYLTVKWRDEPDTIINGEVVNHGKQTKRVGKGEKVRFEFNMPTETDQEIIIYAGRYLKSLGDVSNLQPTTMLLANASKLTSVVCSSPKLINTDLSKLLNIQNIDLHGCTALGSGLGAQPTLELSSCRYLKTIDVSDTKLTAIYTNLDGGSIESIKYPTTIQSITLKNQERLKTIGIPYDPSNGVECTGLSSVELQNCPNVTSLTIDNTVTENMFESLKYTQKLILRNSLDIDRMNFGAFKRLTQLSLSDMRSLVTCGFDDMNNVGDTGVLGNVSISNCPKIDIITFNVTSPEKSIVFTNGATLDLSQAYTLRRIEANTPVIGLNTIILNRDIQDIILSNKFNSEVDGDIKNLWSYSVATKNLEEGYEGIDFKDLDVKNIDLSTAKRILNNRNFNVNMDGIFVINQVRDGLVYPFMKFNTVINLTNYTGSYAGLFKNTDLSSTTFICNKDITATDFSSMFEGANIENCDITPILSRIKNATNCTKMFKDTAVSNAELILNQMKFGLEANLSNMFENCTNIEAINVNISDNVEVISNLFKGCTNLKSIDGSSFGAGITTAIDWLSGCPVTSANNIIIKNNAVKFNNLKTLKTAENLTITESVTALDSLFNGCINLTSMNFTEESNESNFITAIETFKNCSKLINLNVEHLNFNHATDLTSMFENCSLLSESPINKIADSVLNITKLFAGCPLITTLENFIFGRSISTYSNWTPPNLENLINPVAKNNTSIFREITTLINVDNLTLLNVDNSDILESYFQSCTNLENVTFNDNCNLSMVTNISAFFRNCSKLRRVTLPELSSSLNIEHTFSYCGSLEYIEFYPKQINITGIYNCFLECSSLRVLKNFKVSSSIAFNFDEGFELFGSTPLENTDGLEINSNEVVKIFKNAAIKIITELSIGDEVTNLESLFEGCSSLEATQAIKIKDNVTNINNLFKDCSSLSSIDGMVFGSGIISATDWLLNCPVESANNIIIKSNAVKFKYRKNLKYVNNLTLTSHITSTEELFRECWGLLELSFSTDCNAENIILTDFMVENCRSLIEIDLTNLNLKNSNNLFRTFNGCSSLTKIIFNQEGFHKLGTLKGNPPLNGAFQGCSSLVSLKNFKIKPTCNIYSFTNIFLSNNKLEDTEGMEIGTQTATKIFTGYPIKRISDILIGANVTDLTGMFSGCKNLVEDIVIPNHITNVTEMFKGCSSMTHVHSNWDNEYDNEIISTDCYAGCTEITHIDGKDIGKSEYVNGLDGVPPSWGGYGLYPRYTTICEFIVEESNLTLTLTNTSETLYDDKFVDWGDGTVTYGEREHTYSKAGTYVVKGKYWFNNQNLTWAKYVSKIIKMVQVPVSGFFCFSGSKYLTYANLKDATLTNCISMFNMYQCKSVLTTVIFDNTTITSGDISNFLCNNPALTSVDIRGLKFSTPLKSASNLFYSCTNLSTIVGIESLDVSSVTNFSGMFRNCTSISDFSFIENWNMSKAENLSGMFANTNIELINLPHFPNATDFGSMFEQCSKLKKPPITTFGNASNSSKSISYSQTYGNCKALDISSVTFKVVGKCNLYRLFVLCQQITEAHFKWETDEECNVVSMFVDSNANIVTLDRFNLTSCVNLFDKFFFGGIGGPRGESLVDFDCYGTQSYSLDISNYRSLSKESLLKIIDCLCDNASDLTLRLGSKNMAKLTDNEIAIATSKGWIVS